ncbi:MAG: SDR family oxidoreductase [Candidatus Obscuribacterales bacterium]|nr:SDR family oxidoreductase [Candidatus Obscuribacterales bacterium]
MDFGIKGKHALVCAASRGLGFAIAKALAQEGVDLTISARDSEKLNQAAEAIRKLSTAKVECIAGDLSVPADRQRLIDFTKEKAGGLDILVHNVGGPKAQAAQATSSADWQEAFDKLFLPIVELNQTFLPGMKERKWGRIITVTSLSVIEPIANLALSNGIRSAVTAMLKTLSDEVAQDGITVNCLAPGLIQTARTDELMESRRKLTGQSKEDYMTDYVASIPAKRLGDADEFGAVAAFLASTKAQYVTGQTICVDGGKRRSVH